MSIVLCASCGHNIADKHCKQCVIQLANEGIVWTQFGVMLTGYAALNYLGPLFDPTIKSNSPIIIQLLGQARAGKDFTASTLKSYYESVGKSAEIYSYAAPMKQIAATLFDISLEQLDEFKNNSNRVDIEIVDYRGYTETHLDRVVTESDFRTFLQRLGNEAIKPVFGDAVWANLAKQHINKSKSDIIIIPDCRFLIELNTIGGKTIRVVNNSLPPPMDHPSELELANYVCNFKLDNTNYQATEQMIADLAERILI